MTAQTAQTGTPISTQLGNWDLDTGRDDENDQLVYWGVA